MDAFLDYLIKKSDINKEFSIESNNTKKKISCNDINYKKILVPNVDSYVVFDFETTGMNPSVNRIIEVGAVKVIDNLAVIDRTLCTGCGKCKAACKRGVII